MPATRRASRSWVAPDVRLRQRASATSTRSIPHRIVIGGAIAEAEGERLLQPIREAIATEAFKIVGAKVSVVPAALGGDVSLAGAQPLVMRALAGARTVDATRGAPGGSTGADRAPDRPSSIAQQPGPSVTTSAATAAAIPGGTAR